MALDATLQPQLLDLLAAIGFHEKYYGFVEQAKQGSSTRCSYETFCDVLAGDARLHHNQRERFFRLQEAVDAWQFDLKLAYLHSRLEAIVYVRLGGQAMGGVFPQLAREAARRFDPDFEPKPRSPKLPLGDVEETRAAVRFAISLYESLKAAVLSHSGWQFE